MKCKTCNDEGRILSKSYLEWIAQGNEMPLDQIELTTCSQLKNNQHPDEAYNTCPDCKGEKQ